MYNFSEKSTEIIKIHNRDWITDTRSENYGKYEHETT